VPLTDRDGGPEALAASIRSLADIAKLPFTSRPTCATRTVRLFASPMEEVVRLHASSGTTGKPIVVAYTQLRPGRLDRGDGAQLRGLRTTAGDVIRTPTATGCLPAAWACITARSAGRHVIPISGGNTERQLMVMQDSASPRCCCTPSYFLYLLESAQELKIDFSRLRVESSGPSLVEAEAGIASRPEKPSAPTNIYGSLGNHPVRRAGIDLASSTDSTSSRTTSIPDNRSRNGRGFCPTAARASWF